MSAPHSHVWPHTLQQQQGALALVRHQKQLSESAAECSALLCELRAWRVAVNQGSNRVGAGNLHQGSRDQSSRANAFLGPLLQPVRPWAPALGSCLGPLPWAPALAFAR